MPATVAVLNTNFNDLQYFYSSFLLNTIVFSNSNNATQHSTYNEIDFMAQHFRICHV